MVVPLRRVELRPDASSLGDEVFVRMSSAILDGTLAPGEILRVDDLESWLGVSRTPIREALAKLAHVGLVETQPGRFTRVCSVDSDAVSDAADYFGFHGGIAFRLAAEHLADSDVSVACDLLDGMDFASDTNAPQAHFAASRRLVNFVAGVAGNKIFLQVAQRLNILTEWNLLQRTTLPGTLDERRADHLRLREAIRHRDPDYAEFAFRAIYRSRKSSDELTSPHLH